LVKLIVGLGNPGKKYQSTRHNLGFFVIDRIAAGRPITVRKRICEALTGEWAEDGERILLAKPQTYMNRSGACVKELLREFHGSPNDLVVIYDDLDLPFGRIRIRTKGSAGGHRGVISIAESLAGAPFPRVRVGIGRPPEGVDAVDYVLEPFDVDQRDTLDVVVGKASEAVLALLREGVEAAMREFNRAG
jgi:PTH1 family peptidyl-tRNA hydrolase